MARNPNRPPKPPQSVEDQLDSAGRGNKGARNARREARGSKRDVGEIAPPVSEFLTAHSAEARLPAQTASALETTSVAPRVVTRGQLADGATWEQNEKGETVITKIKKLGLAQDRTESVLYLPTIPELNQISEQIKSGVATSGTETSATAEPQAPKSELDNVEVKPPQAAGESLRGVSAEPQPEPGSLLRAALARRRAEAEAAGMSLNDTEVKPPQADVAPEVELTEEEKFEKRGVEVRAMLQGQDFGDAFWGGIIDPVAEADVYAAYGRYPQALEVLEEAVRKFEGRATAVPEPAQAEEKIGAVEKERKPISHAELEDFVREKLGKDAEITDLAITETPEGLQIQATLQHKRAGEINVKGIIANDANTVGVQGLEVTAEHYKAMASLKIEKALSGIGAEMKAYFERQLGQPISSIQVGESGLTAEFEPSQITAEPIGEKIAANPEDAPDYIKNAPDNDDTKKEKHDEAVKSRTLLGKLIDGYKQTLEGASERFAKSKNYLNERAKEIDAQAQTSKAEKFVRGMGEIYNKLNGREKLGIGIVLGASAVVSGGASIYLPYLFTSLLGAQRAFGMASMYLSQEKILQGAKVMESGQIMSLKERASISAALSGAVMGAAIGKGIEWANESGLVERTREWLGSVLGHSSVASGTETLAPATATSVSEVAPAPGPAKLWTGTGTPDRGIPTGTPVAPEAPAAVAAPTPEPAAAAAAGGVATPEAPEVAPKIPNISVEAVKGQGYEYMMKRLWEDPKMVNFKAEDYFKPDVPLEQQPDVYKLLSATPETIDKVVHQIAANPDHNFYNADGTSVSIDMSEHMTINAEGNIQLGDVVKAPEGAHITPPFHPDAPVTPHVEAAGASSSDIPVSTTVEDSAAKAASENYAPLPETPAVTEPPPAPPLEKVDMGVVPEPIQPIVAPEYPLEIVEQSQSIIIPNQFGLGVSLTEPHIYADPGAEHLLVYGGSPAGKMNMITEYLTKNPNKVVFGADNNGEHRILWHMVDGKIETGGPMRTSGFLGFFSDFMEAPKPDEFEKLIK